MADYVVMEELLSYLVTQGVAQRNTTAVSTSLPSVWLDPRDGAPLPRAGENITITLRETLAGPPGVLEEWMERTTVDVIVRARTARPGKLMQRTIHNLLVPYNDSTGGRHQWTMGSLLVERSFEWRGVQGLPSRSDPIGSQGASVPDSRTTYDTVSSYMFDCRRKVLAGLSLP